MTNGAMKLKRKKGKWKRGMCVGADCNLHPIRVGDTVRLRYDQLVGYGTFSEVYVECEVVGRPKGGLPMLVVIATGGIWEKEFDPEVDLEVAE